MQPSTMTAHAASQSNYILKVVLLRFVHTSPTKTRLLSPHHGAKIQAAPEEADIPSLDAKGVKCVRDIVGALLFYVRAVDNKVLADLNTIGTQQAAATKGTNEAIDRLLDYSTTYPDDGIVYRARKMVLAAHSYAVFYNESKGRI